MDPNDLNKNKTTSPSPAKNDLASLPPLPEAEDDTFSPPPPPPTPLPNESMSTDASPEPVGEAVAPPIDTGTMNDDPNMAPVKDGDGKKPKKKSVGKIVGAVIALVLLVGVPMVALNIDKFRGDIRQRASEPLGDLGEFCRFHETLCGTVVDSIYGPVCSNAYQCDPEPTPADNNVCTSSGASCTTSTGTGRCRATGAPGKYYCQVDITSAPTPTSTPQFFQCGTQTCEKGAEVCCLTGCKPETQGCGVGGLNPTPTPTNIQTPCALGYYNNGTTCVKNDDGCVNLGDTCTTSTGSGKCRAVGGGSERLYCQVTITSAPTPTSTPILTPTTPPGGGIIECGAQTCDKDTQVCCLTGCKSIAEGCSGGGGTPTATPTGAGGACVETRIYTLQDGTWKITTLSQVGQFAGVGDKVRLAARGDSSQFSKGRFRVNSETWVTTTAKNTAGEFYMEYTLSQAGTYNIEGQVQ